jgi:glycosyltransferase involved in cell wall biosynthesis
MRIALLQHPWQLTFRGKWDWSDIYNDPRGMSGSELGFVEIGRQLAVMGHDVLMFTDSDSATIRSGMTVLPWQLLGKAEKIDLAIGINHAGGLEHFDCPKLVCQWLNSFEYMTRKEFDCVDLWLSPSVAHRDFIAKMGAGFGLQVSDGFVNHDPLKWQVVPLGCTPELYEGIEKVPGRVVYASSPDRGLHHLLQAWPSIKRRVPGAELKIYYRILPWIEELKAVPEPFPPVEENRQRALFIEDALRRLSDPKWGVEVAGPVSRNGIVKAMGEAEVLAYPCDTLRWSEGFSCTTLEACAARTVPVLFECDALTQVYGNVASMARRGDVKDFALKVGDALREWDSPSMQSMAVAHQRVLYNFAQQHTWRSTCQKILNAAEPLTRPILGPSESAEDSSSLEAKASETPVAQLPT